MKTLITIFTLIVMIFTSLASCTTKEKKASKKGISGQEIGIRKTALVDDNKITRKQASFGKNMPGQSTKIARSFNNAPPLIPHSTKGFVPITIKSNSCIACHMPKAAEASGATPIPISHLTDTRRNNKDLMGKLDQARFVCTTCHVAQADNLMPVVKSTFTPGFTSDKMKSSSDLLQKKK